ncbi:hypothetical protein N657DRAFT_620440 [Parathielavia appendiculata]|uniref:Leucine rich repeat domain containing protein n=1 Tax=Parathielavia appendiculata TaxID=2587402 RepID=A0AAN6TXW5_9PEZI|nr:hypothetical protein N657DRAFT_620440 [Parathielavia appendiculata]
MDSSGLLPSYEDATTSPDWLDLVAPYIPIQQYASLCVVSKRFYHQFARRLWNDPITVICLLKPSPDPQSLLNLLGHASRIPATSSLPSFVRSLDTRRLVADPTYPFLSLLPTRPLSTLLSDIACTFPQSRCILLDSYPGLEPQSPTNRASFDRLLSAEPPLLLSISRCQVELPASYFSSSYLKNLVYLDVSDMPGSLKTPLFDETLNSKNLPSLRIFKARGREVDYLTGIALFAVFRKQLWSVDLSRNKLTDSIVGVMSAFSFPPQISGTGNPDIEGRLVHGMEGSESFGEFRFVSESSWSATFSHPLRHFADAPSYTEHAEDGNLRSVSRRLSGGSKIRPDSPDAIKTLLSGRVGFHSPLLKNVLASSICHGHHGITHLHLNGNNISASGLAKMIRSSPGQLRHLECDSLAFNQHNGIYLSWLSKAKLSGTLGWAHVFRPVFSANLQVLRIHHSLVTQLLSLELAGHGLSPMAKWWMVETQVLPRAELAYPEAFVPDMNPRLQSLTLTNIPRYSTGPLIEKLINLLKLASMQERAIQDVKTEGRRGPATLLGLRHIRLEFELNPLEVFGHNLSGGDLDFDAAAVMDDSSKQFSFFDSTWSSSPSTSKPSSSSKTVSAVTQPPPVSESGNTTNQSARPDLPTPPPPPSTETSRPPAPEPVPQYLSHTWEWESSPVTRGIWVGPGPGSRRNPTPAVREYMQLVRFNSGQLQVNPVPATPCHVAAGVPEKEIIFSAAWDAILHNNPLTGINPDGERRPSGYLVFYPPKPTRADIRGMKDVIAAIRAYRDWTRRAYAEACRRAREETQGKGKEDGEEEAKLGPPHFHWTGRLEVVRWDAKEGLVSS